MDTATQGYPSCNTANQISWRSQQITGNYPGGRLERVKQFH